MKYAPWRRAMKTNEVKRQNKTQRSYDALAEEYARRFADELDHRPRERDLLKRFAARSADLGPLIDLGCGPGHLTTYVRQFHPCPCGLDFSYRALAEARHLNPGITFIQGDMLALPFSEATLGEIISFYSLIHFDFGQVDRSLAEMYRALKPGGGLLLGFHVGTEIVHVDELWGIPVDLDAQFFLTGDLETRLTNLGLTIVEKFERDPYPEIEYQSIRGYIWAAKPRSGR